MSTCGLFESLLGWPSYREGPWAYIRVDLNLHGVTLFNKELKENKIAVGLFKRRDCFLVLASKYQSLNMAAEYFSFRTQLFEMLLASDMCMSTLSKNEKIILLTIAMENGFYIKENLDQNDPLKMNHNTSFIVMISIMKSCKYAPFMKELYPHLVEYAMGYYEPSHGYYYFPREDVYNYAKQFLSELKADR